MNGKDDISTLVRVDEFLGLAKVMGDGVGISETHQSVTLLAAVSGVLGDRLGFEREGIRHATDFRVAAVSPETAPPSWVDVLWRAMLELSKPSTVPPDYVCTPAQRTVMRRQLAVLQAVGLGHSVEATDLKDSLSIKPTPPGKLAHTVGLSDMRGWGSADGRPRCLVALGYQEILAALREGMPPTAYCWMTASDWLRMATKAGPETVDRLGWLHDIPVTVANSDDTLWKECAKWFLERLAELRTNTVHTGRTFIAAGKPEGDILAAGERRIAAMAEELPACLLDRVEVDTLAGWRLTTLLWAFCIRMAVPWEDHARPVFARLGTRLAEWLALLHFRRLRMTFPADDSGFFTPSELAVFRQLGDTPLTCREIQRRLRGTSKATCRSALLRSTRAGLAMEKPSGCWGVAPSAETVGNPWE